MLRPFSLLMLCMILTSFTLPAEAVRPENERQRLMRLQRENPEQFKLEQSPAAREIKIAIQQGETATCPNIYEQVSEQNVFDCLTSHKLSSGETYMRGLSSCGGYIDAYQRAVGISNSTSPQPTCNAIVGAANKMMGEPPRWAACVDDKAIEPSQHLYACLTQFLPKYNQYNKTKLSDLNTCEDIIKLYDIALQESGNASASRDCNIAAKAIAIANNGKLPMWASCLNYKPENAKEHILNCLQSEQVNFSSCGEARSIYEKRLMAAYGGKMPNDYTFLACDALEPILTKAKEASVSEVAERSTTYIPQTELPEKEDGSSWIKWLIGTILIGLAGWGLAAYDKTIKAFPLHPDELPALNPAEKHKIINEMFDKKEGTLYFTGGLDETVPTQFEHSKEHRTGGSYIKHCRIQAQFRISRSIASMPHREREAARILELLINNLQKTNQPLDSIKKLRFGIIWGDGKASIDKHSFSANTRAGMQNNLAEISDYIAKYAKSNSITNDGTVSSIFSLVETLKENDPDNPLTKEVSARLSGGSRWFTESDIAGTPFSPVEGVAPLFIGMGTDGGNFPMQYYGEGSLITVGPPGSGKTQCHILPNLLSWIGPAVVLDVTGDLWKQTSAWRESNVGPVFKFNPLDAENSHSFNPLLEVRHDANHIWEDSRVIAEMLIVTQSKTDPFWENSARDALTAIIAYICYFKLEEERHFDTILDIVSGVHWFEFLTAAIEQTEIPSLYRAGHSLVNLDEKTRSSILQTAMTALSPWQGGQVSRVTQRSDWKPQDLRNGRNPTIYLCLSATALKNYAGLVRVILAQHLKGIMDIGADRNAPWIQFFLDELPQLGAMNPIQQALDVGRNHKIRLWMFVQYVSQLEGAYGKDIARGMIGACGVRSYLNPSLADGTAERVATEIGQFESVIDSTRRKLVEPQDLAGAEYRDRLIILASGARPARPLKVFAHSMEKSKNRLGEAKWQAIPDLRNPSSQD
jgi:type IV secretion system protein VirD4